MAEQPPGENRTPSPSPVLRRVSRASLDELLDLSPDALVVIDQAGTLVQANEQAATLFGYQREELLGRSLELLLPERLRAVHLAHRQRYFAAPSARPMGMHLELIGKHQDGSEFPVDISLRPVLLDGDDKLLAIGAVREMSEQRRAESERARLAERLRTVEERVARERAAQLEAIFETMADAVFVLDRQGNVTMTNAAADRHLARLSPVDYITHPLTDRATQLVLADHEGRPLSLGTWPTPRVLSGEVLTPERAAETSMLSNEGQTIYTQVTGGPLPDGEGKRSGAVLIVQDVTERKHAEREREQREREQREDLEAQRELLLLILDELPSSVAVVRGEEARLLLANRAATQLWGAPWPYDQPMQDFLAERRIRLFDARGEPLPPERWATLRAVRQGETIRQQQETIQRPDGTTLPVLVSSVALGTTGRLSRLPALLAGAAHGSSEPLALVIHHDVAALKEAEALKDEFIGIAAHELRNPVTALAGFAQMLVSGTRRGRGPQLAGWQHEALDEIELASQRLVTLTEELLDVTRLQAGRLQLYPTLTDLVALARHAVARLQATTERSTLSLQTSAPELRMVVDAVRIDQVLANLLTNAIKYSPQGGPIEVRIEQREAKPEVLLSVRDSGMGIPREEQAQLFGRFQRASNAQEAGLLGTGLGLYLCRELLALHGGQIWFESVEGTGSTFFVALPREERGRGGGGT